MKKYIKLLALVLIIGSMTSCDLDRFPFDNIAREQSLQSIEDAENWNNGLMNHFRGNQYGLFTFSQDVQVDLLNASLDYGNRNGAPHAWTRFTADDYTIRDVWQGYYFSLKNVNFLIEALPALHDDLEEAADKQRVNEILGNAHFLRAFYYNELALRWSKAYNPSTAATDLSVPLVLEFDVNAKPARATLEAVYAQVLDDIAKAKPLLASVPGTPASNVINKDVLTALEARVKLYMQDWAGAYTAANSLIEDTAAGMTELWVNDNSDEVIFQSYVDKPSELGAANSIYLGFNAATGKYKPDFVPTQGIVDLYDNADIRKAAYFDNSFTVDIQGFDYSGIYLVTKYKGNPALFTGANTNYQHAPKVFRVAEMYLIAAEAAASKTTPDETGALTALNALRTARGLAAVTASGAALMDEIKEERLRELAFEGFRLFDFKRWGEGFTRANPQNTDLLTPGTDYFYKSVPANDNKFVWGLPANDITINPNLRDQQNPGW